MKTMTLTLCLVAISAASHAAAPATPSTIPAPTNEKNTISIQEMIQTGPPQMRLHSLAMITQGKIPLDDSFLETLSICADDKNVPVRSVAARILGQHWITKAEKENPEAIQLLLKFASDESKDVRFNAVYYGLANVKNKSDAVVEKLLEIIQTEREHTLLERIKQGLSEQQDQVKKVLDEQIKNENDELAMRAFEVYEELTGNTPENTERFLELPSSRPVLFIISSKEIADSSFKDELTREMETWGVKHPELSFSGPGKQQVLMVKTYLTGDRLLIEERLANHPDYTLTQTLWLSPQLEAQMESVQQ